MSLAAALLAHVHDSFFSASVSVHDLLRLFPGVKQSGLTLGVNETRQFSCDSSEKLTSGQCQDVACRLLHVHILGGGVSTFLYLVSKNHLLG